MKPTKRQLKQKYGITNNDFKILTEKPSPEECAKSGITVQEVVAWCAGVPTFLLRSATGCVVAVLMIPSNQGEVIQQRFDTFKGRVVMARDFLRVPDQHAPLYPSDDHQQRVFANIGTTSSSIITVTGFDLTDGTSDSDSGPFLES